MTAVEFLEGKAMDGFITPEDLEKAKRMEASQLVIFGAECVVQAESGLGTIGIYENYYGKKFNSKLNESI
jgi:hypothetical protein